MSALDQILTDLPIKQIAAQIGASPEQIQESVANIVPVLLEKLTHNATDIKGAQALAAALADHENDDLTIDSVDPSDGEKMLAHMFGSTQQAEQAIAPVAGLASPLLKKLLPYLAPIVMGYLAKQIGQGQFSNILGPLLNGVLGGGQKQQTQQSGGTILSDLLGSILGGGGSAAQTFPQAQTQSAGDGTPQMQFPDQSELQVEQSSGGILGTLKDILTGK
ncbi:MAG: DUF937 domain-containing protein [Propionibacteriaceae bacterium]